MTQLRPFQSDLSDGIAAQWAGGARNVLAVAPTGAGKTVLFAHKLRQHVGASVAIAHRQELVSQISIALARNGVRHRIIGPAELVKRVIVPLHVSEVGASLYDPNAPCAVAGVDTLIRMDGANPWLRQVTLWVTDECFPAGTLVDGRPIESLKVGESVTAFDEETGIFEPRPIARVFKNPAPKHMVRVTAGHHVLECTSGHPFYTRRGWVDAAALIVDDEVLCYEVHDVRETCGPDRAPEETGGNNGPGILLEGLQRGVSLEGIVRNDGQDKPQVRIRANESQQSDGARGCARTSIADASENRARAESERGERPRALAGGNRARGIVGRAGVPHAIPDTDGSETGKRRKVAVVLQTRRSETDFETGCRGGREQSLSNGAERTGQEKRGFSYWQRVDSIEVYERGNSQQPGGRADDGFVYNVEIEGLHTYIADGVVVHNCHHVLRGNKWGKACEMFPNARGLGVTATPCRADRKGLGRHADGLFDALVVGPSMRELIADGYLTDYRVWTAPELVDVSDVPIGASGDYVEAKLRAKVHAEKRFVGDVVQHYVKHAAGRLGVTFTVDIESATELAAAYRAAGVPAEVVSSKTPDRQRIEILRRFRRREVLQLVNVSLFDEGFDLPAIEIVSMARHTASYGLYCQQFGRALRLMLPGEVLEAWGGYTREQRLAAIAASGKPRAMIIDHVGNVARHGLPDIPRDWTLDGGEKRGKVKRDDEVPVRACPACTAAYLRVLPACPECGHRPQPTARSAPEFVDGDLLELDPDTLARMRGEVARVDAGPVYPAGLPAAAYGAIKRNHWERQQAQGRLRECIAWWAGYQRSQGRSDSESYKRFFFAFGVDVATAQTLNKADAEALATRVAARLAADGVAMT